MLGGCWSHDGEGDGAVMSSVLKSSVFTVQTKTLTHRCEIFPLFQGTQNGGVVWTQGHSSNFVVWTSSKNILS